jgi:hypothetical protein
MPPPGAPSAALRAQGGGMAGAEMAGYHAPQASPPAGYAAQGYPGVSAPQPVMPGPSQQMPIPGGIPPAGQGQAKTLLGAVAPVGLPNYANYTPQAVSAQQGAVQPGFPPGMSPSQPPMPGMPQGVSGPMGSVPPGMPSGVMPGQPMPGSPMSGQMPGQMMPGQAMPGQPPQRPSMPNQPQLLQPGGGSAPPQPAYPGMGTAPYGQGQYGAPPTPPVEPLPAEGRRRSSLARDIAIGVAIAGLVLGGFLVVKFLVLDGGDDSGSTVSTDTTAPTGLADVLVSMPGTAEAVLYIDNNRHAKVLDNVKVQVPAGQHEVKLVGPDNQQCKQDLTLVAGQVITLECKMQGGTGSAGSGAGSAGAGSAGVAGAGSAGTDPAGAGSADAGSAGSGSAGASAGSAGSGSAETQVAMDDKAKAAAEKAAAEKAAADKAAADKAAAEKLAADKAAADKAKADKAKADKAAADKAAAEKAAADKAKADKLKRDKLPAEDNPADRAGSTPSKGWVQLTSKPSAKILVDGNDTGLSTPITGRTLALTPGKHRITFQIGGDKYTFTVTVKAGETVTLDKMLQ